jgi:uncharacterized membrane protein (DUF2068 family)
LLAALGFGVFRLVHEDAGRVFEHVVAQLKLDPENRFIHALINRVSGMDQRTIKAIGLGTFLYAFLHTIEGAGLILGWNWAAYFTVAMTASLIPLEAYEVLNRGTVLKSFVLLANAGIVLYLAMQLIRERRSKGASRK